MRNEKRLRLIFLFMIGLTNLSLAQNETEQEKCDLRFSLLNTNKIVEEKDSIDNDEFVSLSIERFGFQVKEITWTFTGGKINGERLSIIPHRDMKIEASIETDNGCTLKKSIQIIVR